LSLIDRGLLKADGERVAAEPHAAEMVRRPVEKAVMAFFARPREAREIFSDAASGATVEEYKRALACEGLLADGAVFRNRMPAVLAALVILVGVSLTKIVIALGRGRHNIGVLVFLTIVFTLWAIATCFWKRTGAGEAVLRDLSLRFSSLKGRAGSIRPGGMTNEASLLAAVFGLAALPAVYFPYLGTLFPKAASTADGSYSGGCGGGDGGSSGCGGGGCGGGCGGCGG
jgi:uncharacterized protein (TIGR04222 family)